MDLPRCGIKSRKALALGAALLLASAFAAAEKAAGASWTPDPAYELGRFPEPVLIGGFSDLFYSGSEVGKELFYTITDRGPNADAIKPHASAGFSARPLLVPGYSPVILELELDRAAGKVSVKRTIALKRPDGSPMSGLPNVDPRGGAWNSDEFPLDRDGKEIPFDEFGIDPESLAVDGAGNFWVGEEYGPSLLKFDPSGKLLKRWLPGTPSGIAQPSRAGERVLPSVFGERKLNRGFEAMAALPGGKLLLFLQSPPRPLLKRGFSLVLEFDMEKERPSGLYLYPMDPKCGKIGAAAIGRRGEVLVLEQNGKTGKKAKQKVFMIEPEPAANFLGTYEKNGLKDLPRPVKKSVWLDLKGKGLGEYEKVEGLALDRDGRLYFVNDNDFGSAVPGKAALPGRLFMVLTPEKLPSSGR